MHTFVQNPKAPQQTMSAKSTIPGQKRFGQSPEARLLFHSPRTIGNESVQRMLEPNVDGGSGKAITAKIIRFGHDFSKISVAPPGRVANNSASDNNSGLRSAVRYHRHTFSAVIPRFSPIRQNDSMSDNERKPAMDVEARADQIPIDPSERAEEGKTVYFSQSLLPAVTIPAQWDAIASSLTYSSSINSIKPPSVLTKFGQTDARIEVNKSKATQTNGTFNVELIIDNVITYWVAGGTRTNIASDTDPHITQTNYPKVISDLTPSATAVTTGGMALLKNQSPRSNFWAEDLTIKHESFHMKEDVRFGREGATLGQNWLNKQTARNFDEVGVLLGKVSQIVAQKILTEMAPPDVEQRAYDFGAADYLARARAIKSKGDAKGYIPKPTAPQVPTSPSTATPKPQDMPSVPARNKPAPK